MPVSFLDVIETMPESAINTSSSLTDKPIRKSLQPENGIVQGVNEIWYRLNPASSC
jgi:hypothetical protein